MSSKHNPQAASWLFCLINLLLSYGGRTQNDFIVGGIFSEHYPRISQGVEDDRDDHEVGPCGKHNRRATADRLAMEFAISEINNSTDILPGIVLGTNMKDTCSDLDYAVNNTLDYDFIKERFVNKSYQCAPQETRIKCCWNLTDNTPLVAIIAGGYSHIIKAIVNLVGLFKVPVIGYSSTSPSLNKMDYFLRTIPPDTDSTQVMVDLIEELGWNVVLLLYVDNDYGHYAADCFRTALRSLKNKICIAYDEKFSKDSSEKEIRNIVDGMTNTTKSRIVIFFGSIEDFLYFHDSAGFDINRYVWISTELWLRSDLIGISKTIKNLLTIIPEQRYKRNEFIKYLREKADVNGTCPYIHGKDTAYTELLRYNRDMSQNCSFERSKYIPHVLDAVYAVAMALHNMLSCQPGKSCRDKLNTAFQQRLLSGLKNLSVINSLTNDAISFDENGNPKLARFTVVKLEIGEGRNSQTIIGNWSCEKNEPCDKRLSPNITELVNASSFESNCGPACAPGSYKSVKEEYPDCCWTCEKCAGNTFANTSGQRSCEECPSDRWPDLNHTFCREIEHDYLGIRSASGLLILVWNCFGMLVIALVGGIFLKYGTSHIVKASSRQLSLLLLLGISIDFALIMSLLWEPNIVKCTVIFTLSRAADCLVTSTLFMKTNRIHRIFRKSAMSERPRCLGNGCQLFIIMILVLIELALVSAALVFRPENGQVTVTYFMQGEQKMMFLLCSFFGQTLQNDLFHVLIWSYDCGMIFVCTYQAYLVRKVPENYNEARYITFTMVTRSMNIIVYIITSSGMEGKNQVLVFCIFQCLKASVALSCMFLPKVYILLFQPERNVPHNPVQSKLGTFVEEISVIRIKPDGRSSGSSSQVSEPTEMTTGGSGNSSSPTRGKMSRKVGREVRVGPEEEVKSDLNDLRASEEHVSTDNAEGSDEPAGVVLVNTLANSDSTA